MSDAPPAPSSPEAPADSRPRVLLDTQVVMEWLVFRDPHIQPLSRLVELGQVRWLASPAMRDELLHVLSRGVAARWQPDPAAVNEAFERWCELQPEPLAPSVRLRCRDGDDQKFIDLALACGADALISRDGDLLALAKRARKLGLPILRPQDWLKQRELQAPPSPQ